MANNIVIIFGAGSKIGASVAKKFLDSSYKVLTVSRSDSIKDIASSSSHAHLKGDLADLSTVPKAFSKAKELYGAFPRVVIYNAASTNFASGDLEAAFDLTGEELNKHQNINVTSAFLSAKEAIKGFKTISSDETKPKTFIYTGNAQHEVSVPFIYAAGVGKSGSYSTLQVADSVYGKKYGYRFYYADERTPEGGLALKGTSGEAAAEFYFELAENKHDEIPVNATFVPGKGYTKF